jgi:DNA-binding CsgD family transcriptional regulator
MVMTLDPSSRCDEYRQSMAAQPGGLLGMVRDVRRLTPQSGMAAVLRTIAEAARRTADVPFAAIVSSSEKWSNGFITVAVDGFRGETSFQDGTFSIEGLDLPNVADASSMLRLPINANAQEFALLYLAGSPEEVLAAEGGLEQLVTLSEVAGIVIERTLLVEEADRSDWSAVFRREPDGPSVFVRSSTTMFEELAETARRLTHTECAAIATPAGEFVEVRAATGYHAERLRGSIVPTQLSMMGQVIATVQAQHVDDAASSDRTYVPVARRVDLGPAVVVPLRLGDRPIGSLMLGNHRGGERVHIEDVMNSLRADGRLRSVLGLERSEQDDHAIPLLRMRGSQEWDWRFDMLARRELMVLGLLGEGLTNAAIAQRLYLSEKTVRNYVSNTLIKIGMRRVEAAVLAARLLAADPPR